MLKLWIYDFFYFVLRGSFNSDRFRRDYKLTSNWWMVGVDTVYIDNIVDFEWGRQCYDFSLLQTITTPLLLIALIWSLLTHPIWHTYCALSQLDCGLSPYRLFLSWLLSWLITYDTLSLIDLVCAPDPLVYKPLIQTVFFSFDLG